MRSILIAAVAAILAAGGPARAQPVADFYKAQDVTFLVAADTGGGYDLYARALAPYLKKHIPGGPNVIVQNLPGAGGLRMANQLFGNSKTDGSVIGLTLSTVVLNQLTQPAQARYDARKFQWLGTIDAQTNVLTVFAAHSRVRSIDDAKATELIVGATNPSSFLYQEPALMNALLGTRFKIVGGYKGVRDLNLALERGEIQAQVSPWSTWKSEHPDWLQARTIVNIIRTGAPTDDLPGVPHFADLVADARGKALVGLLDLSSVLGRSIAAPPGTPEDRVKALRAALSAAAQDPAFLADMQQRRLPVQFRSGEQLQAYVAEALTTPPETVKSFLELMAAR
jgi:tripartite-type tricarboxylate transporter receptor subunit TctC